MKTKHTHLGVDDPTLARLIPNRYAPNLSISPISFLLFSEDELLSALNAQSSSVGALLRSLVDQWVATGIEVGGFDDPSERHFGSIGRKKHTAISEATREDDDKAFEKLAELAFGSKQSALVKMLTEFWETHVSVYPVLDTITLFVKKPSKPQPREQAAYLWFMLMATEFRFRIAKCKDCGTYFLLPARRLTYKTGTRCPGCYDKSRGTGAVEITKSSRAQRRHQLYSHICNAFGSDIAKGPAWYGDDALLDKIVKSVNSAIKAGRLAHAPITRKWIMRTSDPDNRGAIYRLAKSGKAAA